MQGFRFGRALFVPIILSAMPLATAIYESVRNGEERANSGLCNKLSAAFADEGNRVELGAVSVPLNKSYNGDLRCTVM